MFELSNATDFKGLLEVLSTVNEEIKIEVSPDGLYTVKMDPEHKYMYELKLPQSYFDSWRVEEKGSYTLNLKALLKAMGKITRNDYFKLEYGCMSNSVTLSIGSRGDFTRKKTIPCLDPLDEEIPAPRIFFKTKLRISTDALKRVLDDFDGQYYRLESEYTNNTVKFYSDAEIYEESVTFDKDNDHVLELQVQESSKATYDREMILPTIKKIKNIAEVVTIQYSEDMPILFDAEIPQGVLKIHHAPLIGI